MIYSIIEYKIGVLAMKEEIIKKLKLDIEERERSYQKELQKIRAEDNLLNYIKGMLDITKDNVANFPYYDSKDKEEESEEDFNVMLKYTLKDDKVISEFKSEIKNLYFLEKIGYQHAEQYEDAKRKLEEYRNKIEEAYEELKNNETLKKITAKKEEILEKLATLKEKLQEEDAEIENIDTFYECMQYANLSDKEKTTILVSILEKNLLYQQRKLQELEELEHSRKTAITKEISTLSETELNRILETLINNNTLEQRLAIKITYPKRKTEKNFEQELNDITQSLKKQVTEILNKQASERRSLIEKRKNDGLLIVEE